MLMHSVGLIVVSIILIFILERITIIRLTGSPAGRLWVRAHGFMHPNAISFIRMPMGIITAALWLTGWQVTAIFWFAFWMITDLTDGTIARHCQLETERGKWLDPLSDKFMYFPPLLMFAHGSGTTILPPSWTYLLVFVDALGQASRLMTSKKAANYFGKAKTALITITLATAALNQVEHIEFVTPKLLYLMTVSCTLLAFLSVYCKVIPDVWYANSLTLANFICGAAAVWQFYFDRPLRGFILVFIGQFFDLFDGRLARRFGSTRHGAFFDDVADGTSFGLAIAVLIYRSLGASPLALPVATLYFCCVVFRLYRFMNPKNPLPAGIFDGLPSPGGAMLAGSAAILFIDNRPLVAAFAISAALLMVSHVKYLHFGQRLWPGLPNFARLICFIFCLIFVNMSIAGRFKFAFGLFCFIIIAAYVVFGVDYPWPRRRPPAPAQDKPTANGATPPTQESEDAARQKAEKA